MDRRVCMPGLFLCNRKFLPVCSNDWCGPCQMLAPVVHEIAKENAGVIKVGKINVDEQMELARKFRVFSIPTLVLFKEGKAVSSLVGFHGKEEIEEMLKSTK